MNSRLKKTVFLFILGVFLLGMSSKKTASGKLVFTGNEPFSFFILKCDDGQKFKLKGLRNELLQLQGRRVEIVYSETDAKELLPVVQVIQVTPE